jgi:integrase
MKQRGLGGVYRRGTIWWVYYSFRGTPYRESSGSPVRTVALKLLKRRYAETGKGQLTGPDIEKTTLDDLLRFVEDDYKANDHKSIQSVRSSAKRLQEFFGPALAVDLTYDRLIQYGNARRDAGRTPRTVQKELNMLKRGFNLGRKAGRAVPPPFPTITVSNARTGFFEREDFEAVRLHLPSEIQPVVTFAYFTGWRINSEILPLQWKQVDWTAGTVRLEPGTTKNDEGRMFPFAVLPELADVLKRQWEHTKALQRATGCLIAPVFHRDGISIKDYRGAWDKACESAKVVGRIPHDLRRTAVRNLERAGVPRSVAMKLTGHKTESVYRRYAIVSEADLNEGLKKLATLHDRDTNAIAQARTVTVLSQF